MKFTVEISDKIWTKAIKRAASKGITADSPEEMLELMIATSISGMDTVEQPVTGDTTTSIYLASGRIRVVRGE